MLNVYFDPAEIYGNGPGYPSSVHAAVLSVDDAMAAILRALDKGFANVILYSNSERLAEYVQRAADFYEEPIGYADKR
jgi:hypothetical protein